MYLLIKIGDNVILLVNSIKAIKLARPHPSYHTKKRKRKVPYHKQVQQVPLSLTVKKKTSELGRSIYRGGSSIIQFLYRALKTILHSVIGVVKWIVLKIIVFITFPVRFRHRTTSYQTYKANIHKKKGRPRGVPFISAFRLFVFGSIFSFLFIFLPLLFILYLGELPDPHSLSVSYIPKTTKILDRNGTLLYEVYANQNRTLVKLEDIPVKLQQATIAIEDKDFYHHPGFDIRGITRAFLSNVKSNELQGGSTITQQLIKSAFFTPEPSINRKIKEVILAFWSERIYTKQQILELYFNYVPYGGTAWGIEAASEVYFGKSVEELDLAESAFLAGLPRAPSIYSPFNGNHNLWKKRQKEVLDAMVRDKYITKEDAKKAYEKQLAFEDPTTPIKAPHFVMYVKDLLIKKYGLSEVERGGLIVKTSIDLPTQEMAERLVREEVANSGNLGISNGAALITNPQNGDILAMVGSIDYFNEERDGNVNLTTALRQPGSTVKIITYTLALSSGLTETSILDDSPLTIVNQGEPPYTPVNYDGRYRGRIPLRLALANSLNLPAVRLTQRLGVDTLVKGGQAMGIKTWKDSSNYGVSLTLGGGEVTMVELATVFGTVANSGKRVDPNPFLEIQDSFGKVLYKKSDEGSQVVDPGVAFIISDILADNNARSLAFGSNSPLNISGHRVSVKTGTTDNKRDNWTVGFTEDYVVATWVGNNDNTPMSPSLTSGITGAAPIWNKIMTTLLKDKKDEPVILPENVVKKSCYGRDAYFIRGTENSAQCSTNPFTTPTARP